MRISTKLAVSLTITSVAILGAYGVQQLRQEKQDLRNAAEHDFRLLGSALQAGIQNSLREGHPAEVRAIVDRVAQKDSSIQVMVFDDDGHLIANTPGSSQSLDLVRADLRAVSDDAPNVHFVGPDGLDRLIGVFPLEAEHGQQAGTLALVLPLDELRRDLDAETRATTLSILTMLAGIVAVGWILAFLLVRRPLARLRDAMKVVEGGNWVTQVTGDRADEVGSVLAEFNAMVRELNHTREQFVEAAQAREILEAGLQRLDKLATIGQLSASVAHEIGSPLQVLNGRARSLAARSDLPPDVQRTAQILEYQTDRITRIVEQLVSFGRRKPANVTTVDLRGAVGLVADLMEPEARRQGLHFRFDAPSDLPLAIADVDQVQQVALNLVSNAFRATPRGGTIDVVLGTGSFVREGGVEIRSVSLIVEDSGSGIPEDVAAHMFEPFFTTWSTRGGTGLGLGVVKSIVDDHRGTISARARPGGGTRFTVHFPAVDAEGATAVA